MTPLSAGQQDALYREIGQRVRDARIRRGLTQEALAIAVSLTRTSITNIERGRQKALLHTLYDIAAALGVDAASLLPLTGGPATPTAPKLPKELSDRTQRLIASVITPSAKGT